MCSGLNGSPGVLIVRVHGLVIKLPVRAAHRRPPLSAARAPLLFPFSRAEPTRTPWAARPPEAPGGPSFKTQAPWEAGASVAPSPSPVPQREKGEATQPDQSCHRAVAEPESKLCSPPHLWSVRVSDASCGNRQNPSSCLNDSATHSSALDEADFRSNSLERERGNTNPH